MADSRVAELSKRIEHWTSLAPGEFSVVDLDRELNLTNGFREQRTIALERLVEDGVLDRVGSKRGWYRPAQKGLIPMDIQNADETPCDIFLPFGLHNFVNIMPGNILTMGGLKNAGKTALMLNMAFNNNELFNVHYFNSEAGPGEMKLRCRLFCESYKATMTTWNRVKFYERSDDFSDVVFPGAGNLNIVDFFECHNEFYRMGEGIRKIHDKLDGALCFICIQQNPNAEDPLGGRRVTEKSRLHLSLTNNRGGQYGHKLKIEVAKNWKDASYNPRGLCVNFKLANGAYLKAEIDPRDPAHVWKYDKKGGGE